MVLRPSDLVTAISRRLSGGDVATTVFSNSLLLKRIGWLGLLRQESLFVGPRKMFCGMLRQIDVVGKAVGELWPNAALEMAEPVQTHVEVLSCLLASIGPEMLRFSGRHPRSKSVAHAPAAAMPAPSLRPWAKQKNTG